MFRLMIKLGNIRYIVHSALYCSAIGLLSASTSPTFAATTAVNGQIAYTACGPSSIPFDPDQCDIWLMNADGSGQVNLTNTTDKNEVSPAWSPDGTRIAYFEGYGPSNLRIMNADGSNVPPPYTTNATDPYTTTNSFPYSSTPTWSPGGSQIAFVRNNPGSPISIQADIVVIDLVTGSESTITKPADFGGVSIDADEIEPAWSPDGSKIAFAAVRPEQYPDPITGMPTQGAQWEIVIANPDGSGEQVVSGGEPNSTRAQFLEEDRAPAWSPDGSILAFMSQSQVPSCCGPWQIWAVNKDGSSTTNLTNDDTINDLFPNWSPDGTQIVFTRFDGTGGSNLYTMLAPTTLPLVSAALSTVDLLATTSAATPLTTDGNASDPDWGRNANGGGTNTQFTLFASVTSEGKGAGGSIVSTPKGINCGRDCNEIYPINTPVTLTANPKKSSAFTGWSGACADAGINPICNIVMDDVKNAQASFKRSR